MEQKTTKTPTEENKCCTRTLDKSELSPFIGPTVFVAYLLCLSVTHHLCPFTCFSSLVQANNKHRVCVRARHAEGHIVSHVLPFYTVKQTGYFNK